jgi:hypothetical protein
VVLRGLRELTLHVASERHALSPLYALADPVVAFLSVLEGSDQDLLGYTSDQVLASTGDPFIG